LEKAHKEPIAVVGLGCRFPSRADNPQLYWQMLRNGVDAVTEVPADRWDVEAYYNPQADAPGKMITRYGAFLDRLHDFDPEFFGITPREAVSIDPQQRLLLEVCWEALEHAGIVPGTLEGSATGVFVGLCGHDYSYLLNSRGLEQIDAYMATGIAHSVASGRVAYVLGLQGPNLAVDTACSSSLVAVHLACQSLRNHECDAALAAGVHCILSPELSINFSKNRMLSPSGRCKTFDATADGFTRGEGCGVVVLKRLSDAVAANNPILALIRGSAINHDGRTSGLTVPNGPSQQDVIRKALENAGVRPEDVGYVEAHGTGTALGDPIEIGALNAVYCRNRDQHTPLMVGSVKTNIGHLEGAAGIAGLLKAILALRHREIPPHLHFREPSPHIDWDRTAITVPTQLRAWDTGGKLRLAGVSSFGFSGTNAHVILEEAPIHVRRAAIAQRPLHLLTLSARHEDCIRALAGAYAESLAGEQTGDIGDICYTTNAGRAALAHRLALLTDSRQDAAHKLTVFAQGRADGELFTGRSERGFEPKVAFLFSGQGSQYVGMGRELYETHPLFRRTLEECDAALRPYLEGSLLDMMYAAGADPARLDQTRYAQPAIFALEYALDRLWASWGVRPDAVIGHSVGEYTAACIAGIFSLEDGLRLVAERGRLMQALPGDGGMAVVFAPEAQVMAVIENRGHQVAVAAVNGPANTVVSGTRQAVADLQRDLANREVKSTSLAVSHAFHSPLMGPMLAEFERVLMQVRFSPPVLRLISNLAGEEVGREILDPAYWCRHVTQPVRFADGLTRLKRMGFNVFVELGPKADLSSSAMRCLSSTEVRVLPSLNDKRSNWRQLLSTLATLFTAGLRIDWQSFDADYGREIVDYLPTYPFRRRSFWPDLPDRQHAEHGVHPGALGHPLLDHTIQSPLIEPIVYETRFSAERMPFINDHLLFGQTVIPGACQISMILGAAAHAFQTGPINLSEIIFHRALRIPDGGNRRVQVALYPGDGEGAHIKLLSMDSDNPTCKGVMHMTGRLVLTPRPEPSPDIWGSQPIPSLWEACTTEIGHEALYSRERLGAISLGPTYSWLEAIRTAGRGVLGLIRVPDHITLHEGFQLHPGLIDSCVALLVMSRKTAKDKVLIPFGVEQFRYYRPATSRRLWAQARYRDTLDTSIKIVGDIRLTDDKGEVIAEIIGIEGREADREVLLRGIQEDISHWFYHIEWLPSACAETASTDEAAASQSWLVLCDASGIGEALAVWLEQHGARCVRAFPGTGYEQIDERHYRIDPMAPGVLKRLLQDGDDVERPWYGIVHMWSFNASLAEPERAFALGCGSALHLVQALVLRRGQGPRLSLVTRGGQAVQAGAEPINAAQAALWGLSRTIAAEHPDLGCRTFDLDPNAASEQVEALGQELWNPGAESRVAWRAASRYVARLTRCQIAVDSRKPPVRDDANYLIAGGLGIFGLTVAEWLVSLGARRLTLCGRSKPTPVALETVARLEQTGATIDICQADITRDNEVAELIERANAVAPLRGVIHAAGVLDDGLLLNQDADRFRAVMAPKTLGLINLHGRTRDLPLDFFVGFSSLVSMLGLPGQGNYSAANAFMDAFMHDRRAASLPALSINWGPWAGTGMIAALAERDQQRLAAQGLIAIDRENGLRALNALLFDAPAQVGVMDLDWTLLTKHYPQALHDPFLSAFTRDLLPRETANWMERLHSVQAEKRRSLLESLICERLAAVMHVASEHEIGARESVFDLGVDSLMAVQLQGQIEASLGRQLPSTLLFDFPTIEALVAHLVKLLDLDFGTDGEAAEVGPAPVRSTPDDLDALSQDELADKLARKLQAID
jgi:acyl transferase domain-containing protein/acyl carrier protein